MMTLLMMGCGNSASVQEKNSNDSQEVVATEDTKEDRATEVSEEPIEESAENATKESETESVEQKTAQSDNQTSVNSKMTEDFYYIIEDTFELTDREGLVVVGVNMNSPMYTGTEVDILSSEGRIPTQILGVEEYAKGIVEYVDEETNAGVMLANVTKEQVNAGDMIVLRDKGEITQEANTILAMTPMGAEMTYAELTEGQQVQVVLFIEPIAATIVATEVYEEYTDGDIVTATLQFEEPIACIDYQAVAIYNENSDLIAAGRFGTITE